jgi:phospholipase/carboxylesterase
MNMETDKSLPLRYAIRQPMVQLRRPPMLILLHGMGGNEVDFLNQTDSFDSRFLIVSVRAPFHQTAGSAAWYSAAAERELLHANKPQGEYSRDVVAKLIPKAIQLFKTNPDQVYLLGFCQGAGVALGVLLLHPQLVAGVVSISGQLLPEIRTYMSTPESLKGKPILMMHGLQDAYHPISSSRATNALLSTLPVTLEYHEYYMGHQLILETITKAQEWLGNQLDARGILGLPEGPDYAVRLSAIRLKVRNLDRAITFYARYFGMRLVERTGKAFAFLSNDDSHHVVVLENVGEHAPKPITEALGLQRATFAVPDQVAFARAYKTLRDGGVPVSAVDQTICWTLLLRDPDGNGLEIVLDVRELPGRSHLWQGRDLPIDEDKILGVLQE